MTPTPSCAGSENSELRGDVFPGVPKLLDRSESGRGGVRWESLCDLIFDSRLRPVEGRVGVEGWLAARDILWSLAWACVVHVVEGLS